MSKPSRVAEVLTLAFGITVAFPTILYVVYLVFVAPIERIEEGRLKELQFIYKTHPELPNECDLVQADGIIDSSEIRALKEKAGYSTDSRQWHVPYDR